MRDSDLKFPGHFSRAGYLRRLVAHAISQVENRNGDGPALKAFLEQCAELSPTGSDPGPGPEPTKVTWATATTVSSGGSTSIGWGESVDTDPVNIGGLFWNIHVNYLSEGAGGNIFVGLAESPTDKVLEYWSVNGPSVGVAATPINGLLITETLACSSEELSDIINSPETVELTMPAPSAPPSVIKHPLTVGVASGAWNAQGTFSEAGWGVVGGGGIPDGEKLISVGCQTNSTFRVRPGESTPPANITSAVASADTNAFTAKYRGLMLENPDGNVVGGVYNVSNTFRGPAGMKDAMLAAPAGYKLVLVEV